MGLSEVERLQTWEFHGVSTSDQAPSYYVALWFLCSGRLHSLKQRKGMFRLRLLTGPNTWMGVTFLRNGSVWATPTCIMVRIEVVRAYNAC